METIILELIDAIDDDGQECIRMETIILELIDAIDAEGQKFMRMETLSPQDEKGDKNS